MKRRVEAQWRRGIKEFGKRRVQKELRM